MSALSDAYHAVDAAKPGLERAHALGRFMLELQHRIETEGAKLEPDVLAACQRQLALTEEAIAAETQHMDPALVQALHAAWDNDNDEAAVLLLTPAKGGVQ